jgi:threonine synthase
VVLATASPAKFPDTIVSAIGIEPKDPSLEALKSRPVQKNLLRTDATSIRGFIEQHAV